MRVFLFSGHMIDAPGRPTPRFPPEKEGAVRRAITLHLDPYAASAADVGVGGAACGADLLFAEELLQRGATLRLCLAYPQAQFLRKSVSFAGADWVRRFHVVAALSDVRVFPPDSPIAQKTKDPFERANLWMLEEAARLGGKDVVFLCVWDGKGGGGPGGTAHMVTEVERLGGRVDRIDPREL